MTPLRVMKQQRGQATVELALILPLMVVLILGVVQFYDIADKSFAAQWRAWRAAREGLATSDGELYWTIQCYRSSTGGGGPHDVPPIGILTPFGDALSDYRLSREAWLPTTVMNGPKALGVRYGTLQLMPWPESGC